MACNEKPIKSSAIASESNIRILSSYKFISSIKTFFEIVFPTHYNHSLSHFSLYHKSVILSSEIFGDDECEIIHFVNCEILLRCRNVKWNKSPTRPQAYFTWQSHISRPKGISQIPQGIYFVEKSTCFRKCFFLARPAGFEPVTLRIGIWYSIQLS